MKDGQLTIGQLSHRTGMPVSAIRYYEGRGLLRLASPLLGRFFSAMADRGAAGLRATLA